MAVRAIVWPRSCGSYCDGLKNGTYQVVEVYFGCGAPPPDRFW